MRKKDEISNPQSCLNKADPEEYVFVFRAQDKLAPLVLRYYKDLLRAHGIKFGPEKEQHLLDAIKGFESWPNRRLPD
jgi:hypothetical protein